MPQPSLSMGTTILWMYEQEHELASMCKTEYSKYIPSMLDKIFSDKFCDMSKYTLTKKIPTCYHKLTRGSATWTLNDNVYVGWNHYTKTWHPWLKRKLDMG